jgi:hypothetical protein
MPRKYYVETGGCVYALTRNQWKNYVEARAAGRSFDLSIYPILKQPPRSRMTAATGYWDAKDWQSALGDLHNAGMGY